MKNFVKYLKMALLLTWVTGCVVGAGYKPEAVDLSSIGFMAFIVLCFMD